MPATPHTIRTQEQDRQPDDARDSSVLFRREADRSGVADAPRPACFTDAELDRIVARITAGRERYDLTRYYYLPAREIEDVTYRQDVMRTLDDSPALLTGIRRFAEAMEIVRNRLEQSASLRNELQQKRWFLDAASLYCAALARLDHDLADAGVTAAGLSRFHRYLQHYLSSTEFATFAEETKRLEEALGSIRYSVLIEGLLVRVRACTAEEDQTRDYGAQLADTFRPFRQDGDGKGTQFKLSDSPEMNFVEASILERVAKLNPDTFEALDRYVTRYQNFADSEIVSFDREIQFYVAYIEYMAPFREAGLHFCYPRVTQDRREVFDDEGFDLALATTLLETGAVPVCNGFHLTGKERIIVVTGPNQGGKTTFARTFAQLHYLAALGCPVPGTRARLPLADAVLTHFEKGEAGLVGRGKLEDDLLRIRDILERASAESILILNEIFDSTTVRDARLLSREIMEKIARLDALCVWVTFLDELASANEKTLSMVATVQPDNPTQRTYRIIRTPPDGLAYALSIAEQYGLTSTRLAERLGP